MYNIDTMKKSVDINDLLKQRDELRAKTNRDAKFYKVYSKLSMKIQYYSNAEHRKAKNEKDLDNMRQRFKTEEYNEYMRNYMRVYNHKNDNIPVENPLIIF